MEDAAALLMRESLALLWKELHSSNTIVCCGKERIYRYTIAEVKRGRVQPGQS